MKTIHKIYFCFAVIILFAANANAGRWITRDPIGFMERDPKPTTPVATVAPRVPEVNLYTFVDNNPVNEIDLLGLSPADVIRLTTLSQSYTSLMTQNGQRMGNGDINNILSSLQRLGRSKNPYLGCGEQADALVQFLNGTGTDDPWQFYRVDGYDGIVPHQWLVAVSGNPNDPQLYLDPWKNQFNTSGNQMHGNNMWNSTFGTVPGIRGGMTPSP